MSQRYLDSPAFAQNLLANRVGYVLSETEKHCARVPHEHILLIPTRRNDESREGVMFGDVAHQSSIFGIESILVGQGDSEAQVVAGDTVLAEQRGPAGVSVVQPCRLESVVWAESSDAGQHGEANGRLVAHVQPLLVNNEIGPGMGCPSDAAGEVTGVWEATNEGQEVDLARLVGRCMVIGSTPTADDDAQSSLPRFWGVGFVRKLRSGRRQSVPPPDPAEKHLPWRHEGVERFFFNRRRTGAHWKSVSKRRVLCTPAQMFVDAFKQVIR